MHAQSSPSGAAVNVPRYRWVFYAASAWAVAFAAPHTWWALGWPYGFPGGPANHGLWMSSWWRYLYNVLVVFLSVLGAYVAWTLAHPGGSARLRRALRVLAWIAAGLLLLRGGAGMIVDGASDPIWWPTFLLGGILFASVAFSSRLSATSRAPDGEIRHHSSVM